MKVVDSLSTVHLCVHAVKADAAMRSDDLPKASTLFISSEYASVQKLRKKKVHGGNWLERSPDEINQLLQAPENEISMNFWLKFPRISCTVPMTGEVHVGMQYLRNVQFIKALDLTPMELMIEKISKFRHACQSNCLFFSRQRHYQHNMNTCGLFQLQVVREVKAGQKLTLCFQESNLLGSERQKLIAEFGDECMVDDCNPCMAGDCLYETGDCLYENTYDHKLKPPDLNIETRQLSQHAFFKDDLDRADYMSGKRAFLTLLMFPEYPRMEHRWVNTNVFWKYDETENKFKL